MPHLVAFALLVTAPAADPAPPPAVDTAALSALLRAQLLQHLPDPLLASQRDWGRQADVTVGVKWRTGKLRLPVAEPQVAARNDGHWQRVTVHAIDPGRTLALAVREVRNPEPGRTTFEALLGLDVRVVYERQEWVAGARLLSTETRVRCRAAVRVGVELTDRLDRKPGALLPDVVLRVRVTAAELNYADPVCEHVAGLDGEAARVAGEAARRFVTRVKPSLERDLLARANAAVVRAADTKEIRVEFDKLLAGKGPPVTRGAGK